ncbi:MAG: hypothetical protein JWO03_1783 [Bacteroidetes bacterium]|nr:hypothetical protein [Bacteroidota bacterium]
MKKNQIIYWTTTVIVSAMMLMSAYMYLTSEAIKAGFVHLGFPDYFRTELAVAKIIGAVVLLIPAPARVKEWVYSAFGIIFISAAVAHFTVDGAAKVVGPLIVMVLLVVSYLFYHKIYDAKRAA